MLFNDRADIEVLDGGPRKTKDGYLVGSILTARTGIQVYSGKELGRPEKDRVRVYRPPEEVFSQDSLRSYAYRPVTDGHKATVNSKNWGGIGKGITGGEIMRDGEFVRVPLILMDAALIDEVESKQKQQVSWGYDAMIEWTDGITPDGQQYDAVQHEMRMNHLAIVSAARGGSDLRIGDEGEEDMPENLKKVFIDGIPVETNEAGAQVIEKLQRDLATVRDEVGKRDTRIVELQTQVSTKDGELAIAKKAIEDSKLTPQKLTDAVKARTQVIVDAKKIAGDKFVVDDSKSDLEIKRAAVATRLGDEATKLMDDAGVSGAFAFAAAQVTKAVGNGASGGQQLRDAIINGGSMSVGDAETVANQAYLKSVQDQTQAWKGKA